jgi:hypothetical protein
VIIRNYQPGDEEVQAAIYNEAAARFPKFKPATAVEVRRRCQARDFDPTASFYVADGPEIFGYATFQKNGRVSYPWHRAGYERIAEPLFQRVLAGLSERHIPTAFTAYRADWTPVHEFFLRHGFRQAREVVNFVMDLVEMPTPPARPASAITPLERQDVPALLHMAPPVLRLRTAEEMERYLFHNPYFPPEALFVLRGRSGGEPVAVGLVIEEARYADPKLVDANMPCYRLGAFGTEGMSTKRINGLFSFLTAPGTSANSLGLDLLAHAAFRLRDSDLATLAAQAPSDAPHLLRFYQSFFRRQGSFPVFEREVNQ